jgi:ribosome-associated protein
VKRGERSEPQGDELPSKSERKREAHEAQALGEELIGLRDAELAALALPEELLEAIAVARRITSRSAGVRQRQYIGKLMRGMDLEPLRERLAARSEQTALEAQAFKRIEAWRERLISEGPPALAELARWRPGLDEAALSRQIAAARRERAAGGASTANRELFRALRTLFATTPP